MGTGCVDQDNCNSPCATRLRHINILWVGENPPHAIKVVVQVAFAHKLDGRTALFIRPFRSYPEKLLPNTTFLIR